MKDANYYNAVLNEAIGKLMFAEADFNWALVRSVIRMLVNETDTDGGKPE